MTRKTPLRFSSGIFFGLAGAILLGEMVVRLRLPDELRPFLGNESSLRRGESVPAFFAGLRGRPFAHGLLAGGAAGLLLVSILLARTGDKAPFIYFQF